MTRLLLGLLVLSGCYCDHGIRIEPDAAADSGQIRPDGAARPDANMRDLDVGDDVRPDAVLPMDAGDDAGACAWIFEEVTTASRLANLDVAIDDAGTIHVAYVAGGADRGVWHARRESGSWQQEHVAPGSYASARGRVVSLLADERLGIFYLGNSVENASYGLYEAMQDSAGIWRVERITPADRGFNRLSAPFVSAHRTNLGDVVAYRAFATTLALAARRDEWMIESIDLPGGNLALSTGVSANGLRSHVSRSRERRYDDEGTLTGIDDLLSLTRGTESTTHYLDRAAALPEPGCAQEGIALVVHDEQVDVVVPNAEDIDGASACTIQHFTFARDGLVSQVTAMQSGSRGLELAHDADGTLHLVVLDDVLRYATQTAEDWVTTILPFENTSEVHNVRIGARADSVAIAMLLDGGDEDDSLWVAHRECF